MYSFIMVASYYLGTLPNLVENVALSQSKNDDLTQMNHCTSHSREEKLKYTCYQSHLLK